MRGMEQIVFLTSFIFQMFVLNVVAYNLKCPSQANWKLRAQVKCNSTLKYFCLYNSVREQYVEGCNGPDWDRKGSKRVFAGDFSRGYCIKQRFQPFVFWTNDSVSDCIYAKSICSEKGQVVYNDKSSTDDRTCRCDYTKSYSFTKAPRHVCYCIPTEEDCSCNVKSCPENYTLSSDYRCKPVDSKEVTKCLDITKNNKTLDEKHEVCKDDNYLCSSKTIFNLKRNNTASTLLCIYIIIIVAGGVFVAVLPSEQLPSFNIYCYKSPKDEDDLYVGEIQLDEKATQKPTIYHDEIKGGKILVDKKFIQTTSIDDDRLNFGEMLSEENVTQISTFDDDDQNSKEIQVDEKMIQTLIIDGDELNLWGKQLNETATQTSTTDVEEEQSFGEMQSEKMVTQTSIIDAITKDEVRCLRLIHLLFRVACPVVRMTFNHEVQPNQLRKTLDRNKALLAKLYRKTGNIINDFQWNLLFKEKTVKSEDFDIRLMIYLLHTLANIKVYDSYPLPTVTSTSAMLSRIKYIRNETTQNLNGKLTEDQFNQYWNDIRQAVLKLASPHTFAINNDQEEIRLIGRLLSFNPISINNKQLCTFIDLSERYPAIILQKIISEYCNLNQTTLGDILREEKHQLYHKRFKTVSCCQCTTEFPKCITEEHWEALYEITKVGNSHDCQSQLKECSESFVPKKIMTFDRFVAETLILHIPNILNYFISRICVMGFENFLKQNKHTINHFMENKMCCTCDKVPTGKILINEKEWNSLFMKEDNIYCKSGSDYCFCQFSVRSSIEFSHVDDILLSKMFNVAGPFGVLYKIGQNTFSYFLNWTVDDQPLHRALNELLNIIEDKQFCRKMVSSISPQSFKTIADQYDAWKWMSKHLQIQRATTGNQHQIFVRDEDGLKVKSVQIPRDFPLPDIATKFDDLSPEENNFLLVFYGLKNIVCPVIKEAFNTKCPDPVLQEICMEIYRANKQPPAKTYDDDDKSRKKRIYLTQLQKQQLFSANWTERRNIDLKLMIHILKQRPKEDDKADDAHQLEVVDNIRREIVQSSSGVLNETRFHEILDCLQIAILHLGGGLYAGKISHLRNVKRILE